MSLNQFLVHGVVKNVESKTSQNGKTFARVTIHVKKGYFSKASEWIDQSYTVTASVTFDRVLNKLSQLHKGCKILATMEIGGYKFTDDQGEQVTRMGYSLQDFELTAAAPTNGQVNQMQEKDENAMIDALAAQHDADNGNDIPF